MSSGYTTTTGTRTETSIMPKSLSSTQLKDQVFNSVCDTWFDLCHNPWGKTLREMYEGLEKNPNSPDYAKFIRNATYKLQLGIQSICQSKAYLNDPDDLTFVMRVISKHSFSHVINLPRPGMWKGGSDLHDMILVHNKNNYSLFGSYRTSYAVKRTVRGREIIDTDMKSVTMRGYVDLRTRTDSNRSTGADQIGRKTRRYIKMYFCVPQGVPRTFSQYVTAGANDTYERYLIDRSNGEYQVNDFASDKNNRKYSISKPLVSTNFINCPYINGELPENQGGSSYVWMLGTLQESATFELCQYKGNGDFHVPAVCYPKDSPNTVFHGTMYEACITFSLHTSIDKKNNSKLWINADIAGVTLLEEAPHVTPASQCKTVNADMIGNVDKDEIDHYMRQMARRLKVLKQSGPGVTNVRATRQYSDNSIPQFAGTPVNQKAAHFTRAQSKPNPQSLSQPPLATSRMSTMGDQLRGGSNVPHSLATAGKEENKHATSTSTSTSGFQARSQSHVSQSAPSALNDSLLDMGAGADLGDTDSDSDDNADSGSDGDSGSDDDAGDSEEIKSRMKGAEAIHRQYGIPMDVILSSWNGTTFNRDVLKEYVDMNRSVNTTASQNIDPMVDTSRDTEAVPDKSNAFDFGNSASDLQADAKKPGDMAQTPLREQEQGQEQEPTGLSSVLPLGTESEQELEELLNVKDDKDKAA